MDINYAADYKFHYAGTFSAKHYSAYCVGCSLIEIAFIKHSVQFPTTGKQKFSDECLSGVPESKTLRELLTST